MDLTGLICSCSTAINENARQSVKKRSTLKKVRSTKKNKSNRTSSINQQEKSPQRNSRPRTNVKKIRRSTSKRLKTNRRAAASNEPKQHKFLERDRTTSLMALQELAEKIAEYRKTYGDIETRTSSLIAPPKRLKKIKKR